MTLQEALEKNTEEIKGLRGEMKAYNENQAKVEVMVKRHEVELYGDGSLKIKGLVEKHDDLANDIYPIFNAIKRALWVIAGAMLAGLGMSLYQWLVKAFGW